MTEAKKWTRILDNKALKYLVAALIPIIGCLLVLAYSHVRIGEYTVFFTRWNDELSYYKQVEGMIEYGMPQGYFGFNESTALVGTFAAWNPTSLIPFYAVGKVFGWSGRVPILFNLILWILVFVAFVRLYSPNWMETLSAGVLYICFMCTSRYIYSVTPESYITVLLFLFFIIFIKGYRNEISVPSFITLDIIMAFLNVIRAYYAVLGLLIIWAIIKKNGGGYKDYNSKHGNYRKRNVFFADKEEIYSTIL